ncbi:pimeloyl-CoA dehydrogenase small subunit [Novosphingobium marinum]|uniref:Alkylation response protein AidB-like acyl-CoA dehydrogenase n=1 Tax=Novosphingobium marinum TaxID=1514948 RepID=A0A7Y9XSH4_9SPHN|nr:acyl-CoA dehydrogenase [Novosphingobium marinum]NYH93746.1 alkylation response protein AidB-like acyl-CoA dehydrogenase [Novosphingobium marinum]GGC16984.1 pimeloyl-CoA dehydrogenase small subunit [Novosphingobium marinum]
MNFDLTEDQEMLKAVAERFVSDRYDIERRREYLKEPGGFSEENWKLLGELGVIAAPFDEQDGGLGLGGTGIAVIYEALGKGLVVEPLAENALLAARLLNELASGEIAEEWMPPILAGERRVALAHGEQGVRNGSTWIETRARREGDDYVLSGRKPYAIAGASADAYIVSARLDGEPGDEQGWGFALVEAGASGLDVTPWRLADGSVCGALLLDDVKVSVGSWLGGGTAELTKAAQLATLARCAEAVGIMDRLFADTIEYLNTREQFGSPLGKFQAIQHRMAAQFARLEQSRALLELAIVREGDESFARTVEGARAFISEASMELGHEMIQFHGGMGVTDELSIGHGHKRLLVLSRYPDDAATSLDRYAGIDPAPRHAAKANGTR